MMTSTDVLLFPSSKKHVGSAVSEWRLSQSTATGLARQTVLRVLERGTEWHADPATGGKF